MQHNSNVTQAPNQLIPRSGKHAQTCPLPSSIKTVRSLCFLWHSGPAFEMQFWKDFKWPFWLFSQQQRSMRGRQWVDPLLRQPDVVLTTEMPYLPENCLFYSSVPRDSSAALGRDISEASLTHHTFSSHHPEQPGPDTGYCDTPQSENIFSAQYGNRRRGKTELPDTGFFFSQFKHRAHPIDGAESQRSDQVTSASSCTLRLCISLGGHC